MYIPREITDALAASGHPTSVDALASLKSSPGSSYGETYLIRQGEDVVVFTRESLIAPLVELQIKGVPHVEHKPSGPNLVLPGIAGHVDLSSWEVDTVLGVLNDDDTASFGASQAVTSAPLNFGSNTKVHQNAANDFQPSSDGSGVDTVDLSFDTLFDADDDPPARATPQTSAPRPAPSPFTAQPVTVQPQHGWNAQSRPATAASSTPARSTAYPAHLRPQPANSASKGGIVMGLVMVFGLMVLGMGVAVFTTVAPMAESGEASATAVASSPSYQAAEQILAAELVKVEVAAPTTSVRIIATENDMNAPLYENQAALVTCGDLAGPNDVVLTLAADDAGVPRTLSTALDGPRQQCIRAIVSRLRFAPSTAGSVVFSY